MHGTDKQKQLASKVVSASLAYLKKRAGEAEGDDLIAHKAAIYALEHIDSWGVKASELIEAGVIKGVPSWVSASRILEMLDSPESTSEEFYNAAFDFAEA